MTSPRLARIYEFYRRYDGLGYYAVGGDNDHDGTPDRADVDDGNGVDCSGCQWAAFRYAWAPEPAPFPLGSTSTYAAMARDRGWFVPLSAVRPGDILLHSENGDIYHSDGPTGHTEMFGGTGADGRWLCYGSSGSGRGVGVVSRSRSFWQAAFRVPGLEDGPPIPSGDDDLTPEQAQKLNDLHAFMSELKVATPPAGSPFWVGGLRKLADLHSYISENRARIAALFSKFGV